MTHDPVPTFDGSQLLRNSSYVSKKAIRVIAQRARGRTCTYRARPTMHGVPAIATNPREGSRLLWTADQKLLPVSCEFIVLNKRSLDELSIADGGKVNLMLILIGVKLASRTVARTDCFLGHEAAGLASP